MVPRPCEPAGSPDLLASAELPDGGQLLPVQGVEEPSAPASAFMALSDLDPPEVSGVVATEPAAGALLSIFAGAGTELVVVLASAVLMKNAETANMTKLNAAIRYLVIDFLPRSGFISSRQDVGLVIRNKL